MTDGMHKSHDSSAVTVSGRFRRLARGFRRRCSNLAWAMAGTLLAGFSISSMMEGRLGPTPDNLGYLVLGPLVGTLVTLSVSAFVTWLMGLERWFNSVEVDEDAVLLEGRDRQRVRLQDIQSVLAFAKTTWLVLRSGDVIELLFFRDVEAIQVGALFPSCLRDSPVELVPTPADLSRFSTSVLLNPIVLVLAGGFFVALVEELIGLPFGAGFGAFSVAMVATAFWRRGRRLIIAKDGIRVGKRFYSLDKLTSFQCTHRRVTWTHAGKEGHAKVRLPKELALALEDRVIGLINAEAPISEAALERCVGEDVHAWLRRVAALFRGGDFRAPAISKERVLAAAHGKGPLRVRVAVLAALKDDAPELVENIARESADPRLASVLEAEGDDAWREAVDALEKRGEL
ncbi:MAG: hypothetical protein AB8H86_06905 [Polyangiales bacterium]